MPATRLPMTERDGQNPQFATVVVPATIQAFFVTELYAKAYGYVSQINVDIGDHVKKGQVLAVMRNQSWRLSSTRLRRSRSRPRPCSK